jgi:ABC-type branched-subunit amino acid transport system substrate-binding protein
VVLQQGSGRKPDVVRDALAADADVLIIAASVEPAASLIRDLRRAGNPAQLVALSLADALPLVRALGRDGAGVALSQVVPPVDRTSLPVVTEYRAAIEAETGRKAYSPASLESYLAAKVLAEAMRQAGPALTRDALLLALEAMSRYDAGGRIFSFSRNNHQGSSRIELLAIGRDGRLLH